MIPLRSGRLDCENQASPQVIIANYNASCSSAHQKPNRMLAIRHALPTMSTSSLKVRC